MITDLNKKEVEFVSGGISGDKVLEIIVAFGNVLAAVGTCVILIYRALNDANTPTGSQA